MGELNQHYLENFNCNIFIETGTGKGTGLEYACSFPFKEIHTIEIVPELYEFSKNKIKDYRVKFYLNNSISSLKQILPSIPKTDRILFWIDAHFPGGEDFGLGKGYGHYVYNEETMPLDKELKVIKEMRDGCKDSLIIDDLRFYENGHYQLGDIDIGKPKSGIAFIEQHFKNTHTFTKDFRHQGFLILKPL
jgi:hypothetical protein